MVDWIYVSFTVEVVVETGAMLLVRPSLLRMLL